MSSHLPPDEVLSPNLTDQTRIIAALVAIAFLAGVFELIRRRHLQERYSVIWVFGGLALLAAAVFPDVLALMARAIGVRDTIAAMFALVIALLLSLALHFTVVLSRQSEQITRLAQDSAIDKAQLQLALSAQAEEQEAEREREHASS